jgi:CMP-N-acetylneuraminic acid synthetase
MFSSLKILAVVPARGGSKGVPRKNIRLLGEEPLIGYTLKTAMSVGMIDDLIVSTDNNDISIVADRYGVCCTIATYEPFV